MIQTYKKHKTPTTASAHPWPVNIHVYHFKCQYTIKKADLLIAM